MQVLVQKVISRSARTHRGTSCLLMLFSHSIHAYIFALNSTYALSHSSRGGCTVLSGSSRGYVATGTTMGAISSACHTHMSNHCTQP
jgi:hypothetical protein